MKLRDVKLATNKFIIVTGLTRSGKTALIPLISSMKNCEQFFFNTIVENLTILNYLNLIDSNVTKNLIIRAVNEEVFDKIYGRNLNNKENDLTNIKKYFGNVDYFKRIKMNKSEKFSRKILETNYFPILFHEALANLNLIENIFNNPKIINISRHPVDIANSWLKKGYVDEFFKSPKSNIMNIIYRNKSIPFFFKGVETRLKSCKSKEDKIILMQNNLKTLFEKNYISSSNKKNILLIKFDDFLQETNLYLDNITSKFNLKLTNKINLILKNQKLPRKINYSARTRLKNKIIRKLSPKYRDIFEKMIYEYESNHKLF